jgi:HPt (histidine-containing phosphotransfer) domain-containing protein
MDHDARGVFPLYSEMRNDPDMADLVELFTSEMPERLKQLGKAWDDSDMTTVHRLAHQLRGSAAGYGFPELGKAAGALEDAIKSNTVAGTKTNDILMSYRTFSNLCLRVVAGGMRKAA